MLTEADFDRAYRAATNGAASSIKRRVRKRASAVDVKDGGWSVAGRSSSQMFWPRLGDIRLVASGVRCAVLLDSCRVPRGAPPLGDVLLALQRDQDHHHHHHHRGDNRAAGDRGERACECRSCGVACLGLLVLEGSCFLVNRALLSRRLNDAVFSCELASAECSSSSSSSSSSTGHSHCGRGKVDQEQAAGTTAAETTSERELSPTPHATGCGAVSSRRRYPQGHLVPALLDVTKSLALPCDRSDVLLPRLHDALRCTFGETSDAAAGFAASATDPLSPAGAPSGTSSTESSRATATDPGGKSTITSSSGNGLRCMAPPPTTEQGEGARWLSDWETKETALDCERLGEVLGGAGLCGFAGWLLEYPVVYCCPAGGVKNGDVEDDADEHGDAIGNCLAGVPLTVYSVTVDFGGGDDELMGCWRGSRHHRGSSLSVGDTENRPFHAFTFSVPEALGGFGCTGGEPEDVQRVDGLFGLVDRFLERLEQRVTRCRASGNDDMSGLSVRKRTEVLDRVAL